MDRCRARELGSGRVGTRPVMVGRKAGVGCTGFGRRSRLVAVVADRTDSPAADSPAGSFLAEVRSPVLVLESRTGWGGIDCIAGRIDCCRGQTCCR